METSSAVSPGLEVTKGSGDDDVFHPPAAEISKADGLKSFADVSPRLETSAIPAIEVTNAGEDESAPVMDRSSFKSPQPDMTRADDDEPAADNSDMDEDEEGLAAPAEIELSAEEPAEPLTPEEVALQEDITKNISRLSLIDLETVQDPFDEALQIVLLGRVPNPVSDRHGYYRVPGKMPRVISNREVRFNCCIFLLTV